MNLTNNVLLIFLLSGSIHLVGCADNSNGVSSTPVEQKSDSVVTTIGYPGDQDNVVFKGEFFSQEKLDDSTYAVTFVEQKTQNKTLFKSKFPFDESSVKNFLPGYMATIEFDVRNNKQTGTVDRYLKNSLPTSIVGAQRAATK